MLAREQASQENSVAGRNSENQKTTQWPTTKARTTVITDTFQEQRCRLRGGEEQESARRKTNISAGNVFKQNRNQPSEEISATNKTAKIIVNTTRWRKTNQ